MCVVMNLSDRDMFRLQQPTQVVIRDWWFVRLARRHTRSPYRGTWRIDISADVASRRVRSRRVAGRPKTSPTLRRPASACCCEACRRWSLCSSWTACRCSPVRGGVCRAAGRRAPRPRSASGSRSCTVTRAGSRRRLATARGSTGTSPWARTRCPARAAASAWARAPRDCRAPRRCTPCGRARTPASRSSSGPCWSCRRTVRRRCCRRSTRSETATLSARRGSRERRRRSAPGGRPPRPQSARGACTRGGAATRPSHILNFPDRPSRAGLQPNAAAHFTPFLFHSLHYTGLQPWFYVEI